MFIQLKFLSFLAIKKSFSLPSQILGMVSNLCAMDLPSTVILTYTLCFYLIYFSFESCRLCIDLSAHLNEHIAKVSEVSFIWNKGNSKRISYQDFRFGLVSDYY